MEKIQRTFSAEDYDRQLRGDGSPFFLHLEIIRKDTKQKQSYLQINSIHLNLSGKKHIIEILLNLIHLCQVTMYPRVPKNRL